MKKAGMEEEAKKYSGGWYTLLGNSTYCLVNYYYVQTPLYYYDYDLGEYVEWQTNVYAGGYETVRYDAGNTLYLYKKNS